MKLRNVLVMIFALSCLNANAGLLGKGGIFDGGKPGDGIKNTVNQVSGAIGNTNVCSSNHEQEMKQACDQAMASGAYSECRVNNTCGSWGGYNWFKIAQAGFCHACVRKKEAVANGDANHGQLQFGNVSVGGGQGVSICSATHRTILQQRCNEMKANGQASDCKINNTCDGLISGNKWHEVASEGQCRLCVRRDTNLGLGGGNPGLSGGVIKGGQGSYGGNSNNNQLSGSSCSDLQDQLNIMSGKLIELKTKYKFYRQRQKEDSDYQGRGGSHGRGGPRKSHKNDLLK